MRIPLLSRRRFLSSLAAAGAVAMTGCAVAPVTSAPPRLRLLAYGTLPHRHTFQGTTVGGLSALDFDARTGQWIALSDDRSELQPARFYNVDLKLRGPELEVRLLGVTTLRQPDGTAYPARAEGGTTPDPEGARLLPDGTVLWTSEGDGRLRLPPLLRQVRPDGSHVRDYALPEHLKFESPASGARNNLTLEGLALASEGRTAWVAMEGPLLQDGPLPSVASAGGACRFTLIDLASGRALRQIAYQPDAIPAAPIPPNARVDNGVSEILMADAHRMLVLERAFMTGRGMSVRLYRIDTREASDTLQLPALTPHNHRSARKELLADFAQLGLPRVDNLEGMTWGPALADGSRTLYFVSDDNFNPLQATQFVACGYLDIA